MNSNELRTQLRACHNTIATGVNLNLFIDFLCCYLKCTFESKLLLNGAVSLSKFESCLSFIGVKKAPRFKVRVISRMQ